MGVCWGSDDLMNAVHKRLALRGYKCEDLFDTGRICQSKPPAAQRTHTLLHRVPTSGLRKTISTTLKYETAARCYKEA